MRAPRMVKVKSLALVLFACSVAQVAMAAAPSATVALDWQRVKGSLAGVSAGSMLFVVGLGKDGKAYRWEGEEWKALTAPPEKPSSVAASADGSVWAVTAEGKILQLEGLKTWKVVPGSLQRVSVADAKTVWGVDRVGSIYHKRDGAAWTNESGPKLASISAAQDGTIWGVGSKGELYRRKAKTKDWVRMTGRLRDVSVGKAGVVAGLGMDGRVYRWIEPTEKKGEVLVASKVGSCGNDRRGYGIIRTLARECRAMGGNMNGKPKDNNWTDCHLDWCVARASRAGYSAARPGTCHEKAAYGIIGMLAQECRALGGNMNGNPKGNDWTACHLDWCADAQPQLVAAKPGTCANKRAYGHIKMPAAHCKKIGGRMNGNPRGATWTACHLDWCEAEKVWKPVPGVEGVASLSITPGGVLWTADKNGRAAWLNLTAWAAVDDKAEAAGAEIKRKIEGVRAQTRAAATQASRAEGSRVRAEGEVKAAELTEALAQVLGNLGVYYPARVGSCGAAKRGYGIITMTARDCRRMGGNMNGRPNDNQWTGCHLDFCVVKAPAVGYSAKRGCPARRKVGYGVVTMKVSDCRRIGGKMNGNPPDTIKVPMAGRVPNWTGCHLDWCKLPVPKLVAAGPGWCKNPVLAYGHVKMQALACRSMGGNYNGDHPDNAWIDCHFDWCYYRGPRRGSDKFVQSVIDAATAKLMTRPVIPRIEVRPNGMILQHRNKVPFAYFFETLLKEGKGRIAVEWDRRARSAARKKALEIWNGVGKQLAAQGMSLDPARARAVVMHRVWNEARAKLGLSPLPALPAAPAAGLPDLVFGGSPPAAPRFCLKTHTGRHYVGVRPNHSAYAHVPHCDKWEQFTVENLGGGPISSGDRVALKTHHGTYVTAHPNGNVTAAPKRQAWETFVIEKVGGSGRGIGPGDRVGFKGAHGKYLSAVDGGGKAITARGPKLNIWETFTLVPAK